MARRPGPILLVQPMQDTFATPINARMFKEEFKERITVVEIEKAGHALLPDQPETVAKAVIEYLVKKMMGEPNPDRSETNKML